MIIAKKVCSAFVVSFFSGSSHEVLTKIGGSVARGKTSSTDSTCSIPFTIYLKRRTSATFALKFVCCK